MIFDLEKSGTEQSGRMDVCVLGAGAAGIALALKLIKKGKRVVLLEGGGLHQEEASQNIYASEIAGRPHDGIHNGRFRHYGGSTNKWGGQILELLAEDFTEHSWIKGSGWPFSKATLDSYYAESLQIEGLQNATLNDADVWREIGMRVPDLGPDLIQYFSRWCPEPNFARLYGSSLQKEPDLHAYLHANACELLLADDNQTIRGVRARTLSGKETVFTADSYVVCLGGIESSRFLLQPHAEARAPWLKNELLGRHFQDHIDVLCGDIVDVHPRLFQAYFDNVFSRGFKYQPRFRLAFPEQARHKILNVAGAIVFSGKTEESLFHVKQAANLILKRRWHELKGIDLLSLAVRWPLLLKSAYHYKIRHRAYNPASMQIKLGVSCEQEPLGESRITLSPQRDSLGLYRTRLDWRISEQEIRTIQKFVEVAQKAFTEKGLCRLNPYPEMFSDPAKFISHMKDSNHHMGGVRMASSADQGVVDSDLKIFGTTNAYVCSSAVFPSSSFSNPTHTLLALSQRLADHLAAA